MLKPGSRYIDGVRQVSAVLTTGIYCRPGCAARPQAEHVQTLPMAAAAEAAGYRACLRCRPYRSPQSMTWTSPELVCRAVRMILDGALDGATELDLGARLGVSGRHLRRLFLRHLGVTPDGLARSARTHFARRLLDDTDLSVLEIAFAAGFGSVRQLNRDCRQVFRMAPRELRSRRRATDRLVADGGLALRLPFERPLDWEAAVSYLAVRAIPGVEHVSGGAYRRTIVVGGHPGVLELQPGGADHLIARAHLPHWEELVHLVARARRIANLDFDPENAEGRLADDPELGPLLHARPGLRPPGTWDVFETGVRAIIGHGAKHATANTVTARVVERLGTPVAGLAQLGLTHTFPSPETVAKANLSELGLPPARARTIGAFARAVADDDVRLDGSVGLEPLVTSLTAIEGIEPPTAHYLALRLGERDACPVPEDDSGRELHALADRWRPWRALAATHLWLLDDAPRRLSGSDAKTRADSRMLASSPTATRRRP